MGEVCNAMFQDVAGEDDRSETTSFSGASSGSSCSSKSNLTDDATSSPMAHSSASSSSSSTLQLDSGGPLYELSPLLAQLPIRCTFCHRRGLSKYYHGKSQSFTSLSHARSIEDLAKKTPYNRRMKTCKSYAAGLDASQRSNHVPGPRSKTIAKKPSSSSCASLLSRTGSTSLLYSSSKQPPAYQSEKDVQMHKSAHDNVEPCK